MQENLTTTMSLYLNEKSKITKILNSEENLIGKSIITLQNKKRMDKSCHIPDLIQAFSNVENGGLNLVL